MCPPLAQRPIASISRATAECSQRGWPHFETHCLRDAASPTRKAKSARIVTADRLN
jgi:hypothetical protein